MLIPKITKLKSISIHKLNLQLNNLGAWENTRDINNELSEQKKSCLSEHIFKQLERGNQIFSKTQTS